MRCLQLYALPYVWPEPSAKQALPETWLRNPNPATAVLAVATHEPACKLGRFGGAD